MCDKKTIEAIDTGKAKVLKTWQLYLGIVAVSLTTLGFVWQTVTTSIVWVDDAKELMFDDHAQKADALRHVYDTDVHMKYQDKVKEFPTRAEFDNHVTQYEKMDEKLDKIYDLLLNK